MTDRERRKYINAVQKHLLCSRKEKARQRDYLNNMLDEITADRPDISPNELDSPEDVAKEINMCFSAAQKERILKRKKRLRLFLLIIAFAVLAATFAVLWLQFIHPQITYVSEPPLIAH